MTGAGGWLGNDAPLRHGYTMARLYELTLIAVRCERWYRHRDFHERADIAWSAIAEHLYAAGEPPSRSDLIRAGMLAIGAHYDKDWAQYGIYPKDRYAETGVNFERYWAIAARPTPGPEERVVERAALRQIWHELTHGQREALTALAVHDDYARAADALGKRRPSPPRYPSRGRRSWRCGTKASDPPGPGATTGDVTAPSASTTSPPSSNDGYGNARKPPAPPGRAPANQTSSAPLAQSCENFLHAIKGGSLRSPPRPSGHAGRAIRSGRSRRTRSAAGSDQAPDVVGQTPHPRHAGFHVARGQRSPATRQVSSDAAYTPRAGVAHQHQGTKETCAMIPRDAQARDRPNAATDAVTDSDVAMIAAAMRRLMLPNDSMRITIRYSKNRTHITVTVSPTYLSRPAEYSPVDPARLDQAAADFILIDNAPSPG